MTTRPLVALDIGSTKVACAVGVPHEHTPGFELLGSSIVPYPSCQDAWLSDPLLVGHAIEQALEAAAVREDLHQALVAINHPSLKAEQVRTAITLGDEPVVVRAHDVERLQRAALHQALGVDREPLLVERLGCAGNGFDRVRDPRGLSATRLTGAFHIVTMPMAARRALVQAVESAGLEVGRLLYTLPAVLASVADPELSRQRVLLVDVGGLSVDIGLFVDGVLQALSVLPWGGLTLATAIASDAQVTMEQAVTWSLEGTACRRPEARALIERRWAELPGAAAGLLTDQPRPDRVLVSGRGGLMDGFVEWIEQATEVPAALCRSARTGTVGDLSRQIGLSAALGLLELMSVKGSRPAAKPDRLVDRLIARTRSVLTEYF